MCVSAELGTRRHNCSIILFIFLFFIRVFLGLVDDFVDILLSLAPHEEVDVETRQEIDDEGDDLES